MKFRADLKKLLRRFEKVESNDRIIQILTAENRRLRSLIGPDMIIASEIRRRGRLRGRVVNG